MHRKCQSGSILNIMQSINSSMMNWGGSALAPGELKRSQLGLKKPAREGEGLRERNSGLVHLVPLGDETKSP